MHTTHYAATEATVYGWADPITGYVWETVYEPASDLTPGWQSTAVFTEAQADWAPYEHPNYFAGRHVGAANLPLISVRGRRPCGADYLAKHVGPMDLIDY